MSDDPQFYDEEQLTGQSHWMIDPERSNIRFSVRHMMVSSVEGQFRGFRGELLYDHNLERPSSVVVEIDAESIETGQIQRDIHLRSGDFLDVENFPHIRFASREVESLGDNRFRVLGELRVRRETRAVHLAVAFSGFSRDLNEQMLASFNASTRIRRSDFGLTWNRPVETGGVLVGDVIMIELDIQANRHP